MSDLVVFNNENLIRKAERISAAMFLVSGNMSDNDLLKTKLREISLELITATASLKGRNMGDSQRVLAITERSVSELLSVLSVAVISGQISEMNGSILKIEIEKFLKEVIDINSSFVFGGMSFPKDFFQNQDNVQNQEKDIKFIKDIDLNTEQFLVSNKDIQNQKLKRKDHRNKSILELIIKIDLFL